MEEQADYIGQILGDFNTKIRDMEERQRLTKDRLLLIGQNLVEIKEKNIQTTLDLRRDVEILKTDMKKLKDFVESVSGELSKFARREDLEILTKQAKMFQPLEFVRKSDLHKIKKEL